MPPFDHNPTLAGNNPTGTRDSLPWPLSAAEIAEIVHGQLWGSDEVQGERAITDSRGQVRRGDLFFGLIGPHFNGGHFAAAALSSGASIAVVSPEIAQQLAHTAQTGEASAATAVIAVDQPLVALQALAAEARCRFSGTVVAITGSNGKTTVKDMLVAALASERRVQASPQSFNSQVGVALSLLLLDRRAEVAIIECGMSLPGEIERLEAIVRPDHGLLTNIGDAHLAGLGSRHAIAAEKSQLFRRLPASGWVLTLGGEVLGRGALAATGARILTAGGDGKPDFSFIAASDGEPARIERDGETVRLPLNHPSRQMIECAGLAAAAALLLGATPAAIERGLENWRPASMRLEMSTTPRGILLINDAYTADPASVEAALVTLVRERTPTTHTVAVLGGMAQLGKLREQAHQEVGHRVWELGVDRLIGVGEGGAEIARAAARAGMAAERIHCVDGVSEAALLLEEHCRGGDRVLLKASRPARLERIARLLFASLAPTRLYVDLDAILANYRHIRRHVGDGVAVMAVVKSFGYGLDAVRLAHTLLRAGLDYLAVAYPDEGARLRDSGISAPILVQNILPHEVDKVVRHRLTAQISNSSQIESLETECARQGSGIAIHLKIDTGMGRAGAFPVEALELARCLDGSSWLEFEGLMTHLAIADDPAGDDHSTAQLRRFDSVRQQLAEAGLTPRFVHAANSAAIERLPQGHYTMVRAGLALLGYSLTARNEAEHPQLVQQPVLRLVTRVVSVKKLPAGQGIGYGLTFETPTEEDERTIAVVAIGYNDGYPWSLSNRGWMAIDGQRCPVVGRVCMDVTLLDVTTLNTTVEAGDEVVVFGPEDPEPSLLELAKLAGTIPYELLTRISPRVRRIFRGSH